MSGVTPILVLLFATVAVAQSLPAQTGPKRLGRPMLTPGATSEGRPMDPRGGRPGTIWPKPIDLHRGLFGADTSGGVGSPGAGFRPHPPHGFGPRKHQQLG